MRANRNLPRQPLYELKCGEKFQSYGLSYIKINHAWSSIIGNAYCIDTQTLRYIPRTRKVIPLGQIEF